MPAFTGGVYNGRELSVEEINTVAQVWPVYTEAGHEQFLLLPPLEDYRRILAGQMAKEETQGPLHSYKRVFTEIGVEYRESTGPNAMSAAQAEGRQPLSDDANERKALFEQLADQFIAEIQSVGAENIKEALVYPECVDRQGRIVEVAPWRMMTTVQVAILSEDGQSVASTTGPREVVNVGNVSSLVRAAPTGWSVLPDQSELAVQIRGFRLVIKPLL